jgi:hypothetical protein
MRHRFEFEEPSANVIVTIDVCRKPRKSIPRGTSQLMPRLNELIAIVRDFIERNCRGNDTALTPFGPAINTDTRASYPPAAQITGNTPK